MTPRSWVDWKSMRPVRSMALGLITISQLFIGCATGLDVADHSMGRVDLARYAGLWYEIASYEPSFQKGCVCTTARYTLVDGGIEVVNSCRRGGAGGERDEARAKAWLAPGSQGGRLKVSFFWPFTADYWVIGLDNDYRWALVGHPQRKYLWILARRPTVSGELYQSLIKLARSKGYEVEKLRMTAQEGCR